MIARMRYSQEFKKMIAYEPYLFRERYDERIEKMGIKNVSKTNSGFFPFAGFVTSQGRVLTGQIKKGKYIY